MPGYMNIGEYFLIIAWVQKCCKPNDIKLSKIIIIQTTNTIIVTILSSIFIQ